MAGVSLALRRMFGSRSYLSQTVGYAYAGLAMAGPWVLTALYMRLIDAVPVPGVTAGDRNDFQSIVLYGYCGSTLLMGLLQFGAARYVSDRIYVREVEPLVPTHAATSLAALLLHAAAAVFFIRMTHPPPLLAAAELAFFGSLALVWTGMVFLGAIRSFMLITVTFAAGMAASLVASYFLAGPFGLAGLLGGFSLGQGLIAAVFAARLRAEFPQERPFDFGFFATLAKYPSLLMIGLAYSSGLWIDKMILWTGPFTLRSPAGLRSLPIYDNAVFLAYLTMIPALALIFIRIEVSFYEKCRRFYGVIREGGDLAAIRACRREIFESFRLSLRRIVNLQGPITLLVILAAPLILDWLRLDWVQYYLFRVACLGAFLQVLVLAVLLTQLHLALYRQALLLAVTYLLVNGGVTAAAVRFGLPGYGYGYVAAGVVTLLLAYPLLWNKLRHLERDTFMSQPIGN